MRADCQEAIRDLLSQRQSAARRDGRPWSEVTSDLYRLPEGCGAAILAHGRQVLEALPQADEGELSVVLSAAGFRGADDAGALRTLLRDAVANPHTRLKEDYVAIVEDLYGRADAVEALTDVLISASPVVTRPDIAYVLDALSALGADESAALARDFVLSDDRGVSASAIGYLYNHGTADAAGVFRERLGRETDPVLLQVLVDGLVMWGCREALDDLDQIAAETTDPEIAGIVRRAAEDLRSG